MRSRPLDAGRFELTLEIAASASADEAQQVLQPYAELLCKDPSARLGPYRFESSVPLGTDPSTVMQTFVQEVACGGEAADPLTAAPAPRTPPTADDERRVRELTQAYLAAKDGNDFDRAHAMLAEETQAMMRADNWSDPRGEFNASAGAPTRREVMRITWYDDPAGAPPGRYVATDFRGDYPHAGFYCGFVMWIRRPDGGYRVMREEEAQVTATDAARIPPGDLASVRAQLGCRD